MTVPKRILLVDDDAALRAVLAEQLQLQDAFETREAGDGATALAMARDERFDAILLDLDLPDMAGGAVCRSLRRAGIDCPVILLTGADSDPDSLPEPADGANDAIAKPFRLGVLLARLRAQLRQVEAGEDATLTLGPYRFRPAAKLLRDETGGRDIRLTEKETAILKYLHRADGAPVGRDELLGEVWGYHAEVTTHTLETHIYRLRRKIEADPAQARLLVTDPGGYRLVR